MVPATIASLQPLGLKQSVEDLDHCIEEVWDVLFQLPLSVGSVRP